MARLGSCAHSKPTARECSDSNWIRCHIVQNVSSQSKYMLGMKEAFPGRR